MERVPGHQVIHRLCVLLHNREVLLHAINEEPGGSDRRIKECLMVGVL